MILLFDNDAIFHFISYKHAENKLEISNMNYIYYDYITANALTLTINHLLYSTLFH